MLEIAIPGAATLRLEYLLCDLNGTLARDGHLLPGVADRLQALSRRLSVIVLTADTHDTAAGLAATLGVRLERLAPGRGAEQKLAYVLRLGADRVAAMGNGRNDVLMLAEAALALAVIGPEGAVPQAVQAADVVCHEPAHALDLLLYPNRLAATLRV